MNWMKRIWNTKADCFQYYSAFFSLIGHSIYCLFWCLFLEIPSRKWPQQKSLHCICLCIITSEVHGLIIYFTHTHQDKISYGSCPVQYNWVHTQERDLKEKTKKTRCKMLRNIVSYIEQSIPERVWQRKR